MARRAAVDADGDEPGRIGRQRECLGDGFAGRGGLAVTALIRQPGSGARLREEVEQDAASRIVGIVSKASRSTPASRRASIRGAWTSRSAADPGS